MQTWEWYYRRPVVSLCSRSPLFMTPILSKEKASMSLQKILEQYWKQNCLRNCKFLVFNLFFPSSRLVAKDLSLPYYFTHCWTEKKTVMQSETHLVCLFLFFSIQSFFYLFFIHSIQSFFLYSIQSVFPSLSYLLFFFFHPFSFFIFFLFFPSSLFFLSFFLFPSCPFLPFLLSSLPFSFFSASLFIFLFSSRIWTWLTVSIFFNVNLCFLLNWLINLTILFF